MSDEWLRQIRFRLTEKQVETARNDPAGSALAAVAQALAPHKGAARSQYDAFLGYVLEAERNGVEHYPLYKWTKATIEDPVKKAKHATSFAVIVDGEEVYDEAAAKAVESALRPLLERGVIASLSHHDTNPANNPQMPAHLR